MLASIAGKLEGRKAEIEKWEEEKNPPLSIGQAWSGFLASVTGNVITVAPSKSAPSKLSSDVPAILKSMTAANWKAKRTKLLALLSNEIH